MDERNATITTTTTNTTMMMAIKNSTKNVKKNKMMMQLKHVVITFFFSLHTFTYILNNLFRTYSSSSFFLIQLNFFFHRSFFRLHSFIHSFASMIYSDEIVNEKKNQFQTGTPEKKQK